MGDSIERGSEGVFTLEHIAKHLHVSRATVSRLVKQPGFPVVKIGRRKIVPADALRKWLAREADKGGSDGWEL